MADVVMHCFINGVSCTLNPNGKVYGYTNDVRCIINFFFLYLLLIFDCTTSVSRSPIYLQLCHLYQGELVIWCTGESEATVLAAPVMLPMYPQSWLGTLFIRISTIMCTQNVWLKSQRNTWIG